MMSEQGKVSGVCACYTLVILFNITVGAMCSDYVIDCILGKNIHWVADIIVGLFLGEIIVPTAIGCWVMTLCGVQTPFVGA